MVNSLQSLFHHNATVPNANDNVLALFYSERDAQELLNRAQRSQVTKIGFLRHGKTAPAVPADGGVFI